MPKEQLGSGAREVMECTQRLEKLRCLKVHKVIRRYCVLLSRPPAQSGAAKAACSGVTSFSSATKACSVVLDAVSLIIISISWDVVLSV